MSKSRPPTPEGEWIQPRRRNFILECCDCGLTHRLNFKLVKTPNGGRSIQFQSYRDNRSTAQVRHHAGIKITRKSKSI